MAEIQKNLSVFPATSAFFLFFPLLFFQNVVN